MDVKPETPLRTLADQHKARGGICHPDLDGNGNRALPSAGEIRLSSADEADKPPAPEKPARAVGQVWRIDGGRVTITIDERLPATDTKPARWACTMVAGSSSEVERADSFFAIQNVNLIRAPLVDCEVGRSVRESAEDAVASTSIFAALLGDMARSSLALTGHIATTMRGGDDPLSRMVAAIKALDAANDALVQAAGEIATARAAVLEHLLRAKPPALAGLRAIAERTEGVGMDTIAGELATMVGDDAQAAVQDLLAALPHLAGLGWIKIGSATDVRALSDITVEALPAVIGTVFDRVAEAG